MARHIVPLGLLLVANALWGSSYVIAKVALQEIPAPLLAALRFSLAGAALWIVLLARARARGRLALPQGKDTLRLVLLGVFGVCANGLLGYWGISLTTATDAALLIVGEVLFTTIFAVALAGDRLGLLGGLGLLLGLVGIVVLIAGSAGDNTPSAPARLLGDLLILTGLTFEASYTVLGMRLTQRYDALTVLTLSISGSCVLWLPLIGWYASRGLEPVSQTAIAGVLYLALVNSAACYLLWFSVLRSAGATLGALSLVVQPLVGAVLGIVVLGEPVLLSTVVGGVCITGCLILAPLRRRGLSRL